MSSVRAKKTTGKWEKQVADIHTQSRLDEPEEISEPELDYREMVTDGDIFKPPETANKLQHNMNLC